MSNNGIEPSEATDQKLEQELDSLTAPLRTMLEEAEGERAELTRERDVVDNRIKRINKALRGVAPPSEGTPGKGSSYHGKGVEEGTAARVLAAFQGGAETALEAMEGADLSKEAVYRAVNHLREPNNVLSDQELLRLAGKVGKARLFILTSAGQQFNIDQELTNA